MSASQKKSALNALEVALAYSPARKIQFLQSKYPVPLRFTASKVIEHQGFLDNDLLYWDILLDANKEHLHSKRHNKLLEGNTSLQELLEEVSNNQHVLQEQHKQVVDTLATLQENLSKSHKILDQKLKTASETQQSTQRKAARLESDLLATRGEMSTLREQIQNNHQRRGWKEWITSPPGIIQSAIAVLLLFVIIFK